MEYFAVGERVVVLYGKHQGRKATIMTSQPGDAYKVKVEDGSVLFFSRKGLKKEHAADAAEEGPALPAMRALIIDDSRTTRYIIRQILKEIGIEALEAGDGAQALARIKEAPDIELVLVDWNMPVMDGLEFVRAVRAQPALSAMRILMVTSESEASQVTRALEAGANEYLMKPFNKDILVAKLNLLDIFQE